MELMMTTATDPQSGSQQEIASLRHRVEELQRRVQELEASSGGAAHDATRSRSAVGPSVGQSAGVYGSRVSTNRGAPANPQSYQRTTSITIRVDQRTISDYTQFIIQEDPYAGVDKAGLQQAEIEFDGPAKDRDQSNPFDYRLTQLVTDPVLYQGYFQNLLQWNFGGKFYRITKAIRIPYSYSQNDQAVDESLFIGYQGPGWP
jgi:hypothetical protein